MGFLITVFLIAVGIILLVSMAVVWSLNTLFALDIEYTWKTMLAAFILFMFALSILK
jgi:hypothetical protein